MKMKIPNSGNMKIISLFTLLLLINSSLLFSQVAINVDGSSPNNSALLDVKSNNKGFLPPRMTRAEMNAIPNPADGLIVFCTDCRMDGKGVLSTFMNGNWNSINYNCFPPTAPLMATNIPSATGVVWDWKGVPYATGYKWNTTNDYSTSTQMDTVTTKSETGLACNTPYTRYVWAYNACGNSQPLTLSQTTLACDANATVTDIDGNVYHTVTIGTQTWMVENLKTTKYRNGNPINNVTDDANWAASSMGAYCWYYNDATTYKETYGALYNWYAVSDGRNIAPAGWHVPTDAEWTTLIDFLGGESVAGGKLKEMGISHWLDPNTSSNSSGFTAFPGGYRSYGFGEFGFIGSFGYLWSSTMEGTPTVALGRALHYYDAVVDRSNWSMKNGFSVRCIHN